MSEKRKRPTAISVRITAEEGNTVKTAAERLGLSVAAYLRQAGLAATKNGSVSAHKPLERALRDITVELQRIGLITRKRYLTQADADRVIDELRQLTTTVLGLRRDGATQ